MSREICTVTTDMLQTGVQTEIQYTTMKDMQ